MIVHHLDGPDELYVERADGSVLVVTDHNEPTTCYQIPTAAAYVPTGDQWEPVAAEWAWQQIRDVKMSATARRQIIAELGVEDVARATGAS